MVYVGVYCHGRRCALGIRRVTRNGRVNAEITRYILPINRDGSCAGNRQVLRAQLLTGMRQREAWKHAAPVVCGLERRELVHMVAELYMSKYMELLASKASLTWW